MQNQITECVVAIRKLEKMDKTLVKLFNDNTGLYDGDSLFQPKSSPICRHWRSRGDEKEEMFMNYNCGHPEAECNFGDGDHCCVMACLDKEEGTQIAGQIVNLHSQIHPIMMKVLDLFNDNKRACVYCAYEMPANVSACLNRGNKDKYCCASNCPL